MTPFRTDIVQYVHGGVCVLAGVVGAAMVVALCATEGRVFRALAGPIPSYLGRISYSLYLWHLVIITAMVRGTVGMIPAWAAVLIGILLSVLIADASARWVEAPCIRLGRTLGRRLRPDPTRTGAMAAATP